MKKLHLTLLIIASVLVISLSVTLALLKPVAGTFVRVNPAFGQYVQAYTSGIISGRAVIKVRLTDDFADTATFHIPLKEKLMAFKPSISGKIYWSDSRTLEFLPDEPLPQGSTYRAEFYLSKILPVPDSLQTMIFDFRVMDQVISVGIDNHKPYHNADRSREFLTGILMTSDLAENHLIETVLEVKQGGKKLPVSWTHNESNKIHHFKVDSLIRENKAGSLKVSWNGSSIGSESEGSVEVEIPALGDFKMMGIQSVENTQQTLKIRFSDPLNREQNLEGLFRVGKYSDLRYSVEDNILWIYLPETNDTKVRLILEPTIKNFDQKLLGKEIVSEVVLESVKPGIRFIGDGTIMPSSNGMLLPFEAVNLKAVDIKIIEIFEKNILQFLQINEPGTNSELARVGRIVLKKTMPLNGVTDYSKWNRFSIDLSNFLKTTPGAIYSVILGFREGYSTYPCSDSTVSDRYPENLVTIADTRKENEKDWGYYSNYYDDDYADGGWRNYRWEERENPCRPSYYFNRSISRNVIASDIGIIAKATDDGRYHIFITDLLSTKPLSAVETEFFNFQLQSLGKIKTDGKGMAVITLKQKPFVLVAKQGRQNGYLKLTDGNTLSLSMFDVQGEPVQKGIKGFIYGERGVWRPGDSIYLTFILEDKNHNLPADHPIGFSLINPSGQLMNRMVKTRSLNGFYNFSVATSPDAPTGNWLARVNAGGLEFQKTLKIETIKPNRLKIHFDFSTDYLIKDQIRPAILKAEWLTGMNAGNLKAKVMLTLTKSVTFFKKYPDYMFDNPASGFAAENVTVFDGNLDQDGKTLITPKIQLKGIAPGALRASFETMVFEEGGDFSVDRFTIPFYPYQTYAGLRVPANNTERNLLTDKEYTIQLINVTARGEEVHAGQLKLELYKLEWRWWWDNTEEGAANFISTDYLKPSNVELIPVVQGKAAYTLRIGYDDWGRYLIKVTDMKSGHSAGKVVYIDWPGYFRMPGGEKQAASMITLTTEKSKYRPGEKVKLIIPSTPEGKALITIETGSKILQSFWTTTHRGSTSVDFQAAEDMVPNCYASVTLIQPHAQTKNDLPVRLYGVVPVFVENPETHIKPVITMPTGWAPGKEITIGVRESSGEAMTYTMAIVDEGLLDLTRFKTPDPWSVFYAREALGVKTWDLYDQVMGAFTGELQRILSIGGDQENEIRGSLKANRFKPMVRFFGPFELKKGQQRSTTFRMPEYIGSVRVMVVGGQNGNYGKEEKTATVKKPLMVLGTLPRILGPGEKVRLPVTVFAMERSVKNVRIEVSVNDYFTIAGSSAKQLVFQNTGDQIVTFDLNVKQRIGTGKIQIIAYSGSEKAEHTIEIDVRNPNPLVTNVDEKALQPGVSWVYTVMPVGMAGTNRGTLELASIPSLNIESRLNSLIVYPFGCLEQITSMAFPQLYLQDVVEISDHSKAEITQNITRTIQRMKSFQVGSGGMGLWPGAAYADDWATSYAGHFMLEAEQKGYSVPVNLVSSWKEFQHQKAISWSFNEGFFNNDLAQAYRLFTLALARVPELGAMNRLMERKNISVAARWQLAAAYHLAGRDEVARQLIGTVTPAIRPYQEMSNTYGSDLRDKAIMAETLSGLKMKTRAALLIRELSAALAGTNWYSTQTTSFALVAIMKYSAGSSGSGISASIKQNNNPEEKVTSKKELISRKMNSTINMNDKIKVTNSGKNTLFSRLILSGIQPFGGQSAAANDLKLQIDTKNLKGDRIRVDALPQGTNFVVEIKVTHPGMRSAYQQLALSFRMPSGWEVINSRNSEFAEALTNSGTFTYQDFRDDRVNLFFDLEPMQTKTFRILVITAYCGRFYLPATTCEAMYDQSINARVPGRWIEVVSAQK